MTDPALDDQVRGIRSASPEKFSSDAAKDIQAMDEYLPVSEIGVSDNRVSRSVFVTTTSLEELVEPLKSEPEPTLAPGDLVTWGQKEWIISEVLSDGWYAAQSSDGSPVLLHPGLAPNWELLASLPMAVSLARHVGPEGVALDAGHAPFAGPMAPEIALEMASEFAVFVRVLAESGVALIDLDPKGIVQSDTGLVLSRWPVVVTAGDPLPRRYREGISSPELLSGGRATTKEGVYILGALLALWIRGEPLGPEGITAIFNETSTHPGLPQLLDGCLCPVDTRPLPADLEYLLSLTARSEAPLMAIGAATSIGCNPDRHRNEDSFGVITNFVGGAIGTSQLIRAAVSDGMGGMDAGDEASRAAINAFISQPTFNDIDGDALAEWAVSLGWAANEAVIEQLGDRHGGATLTAVVFDGSRYALVHVGDSRAYLWRHRDVGHSERERTAFSDSMTADNADQGVRDHVLVQLSQDHTIVAAKVASGVMTQEEALESSNRNELLRALGSTSGVRHGFFAELGGQAGTTRTAVLGVGEALVLVSDGVWDVVSEGFIAEALESDSVDTQHAAQNLVDEAVRAGAPDNATAVVVYRVQ